MFDNNIKTFSIVCSIFLLKHIDKVLSLAKIEKFTSLPQF